MIREVAISNFRCLRDVRVRLGPLTALVGPNASGKSSFLDALAAPALGPQDAWQRKPDLETLITLKGASGTSLLRMRSGAASREGPTVPAQMFRFDLGVLRTARAPQEVRTLGVQGANLSNVLLTLGRRRQVEIGEQLCRLVPVFRDVDHRPAGASGTLQIVFQDRWSEGTWYTADQVSDGTMLVLAFLALPWQEPAPAIVAIEEPERGLHPYLMEQVVGVLRRLARGELGAAPVQVVLATHSAELIEYLEPGELRLFDRGAEDGSTRVREVPVGEDGWEAAFEVYKRSLGAAWLSGTLGGTPGRGA